MLAIAGGGPLSQQNKKQTVNLCSVHNTVMGREQMMLARLLQEEEGEKEREGVEGAIVQQHSHIELKAKLHCSLLMAPQAFYCCCN